MNELLQPMVGGIVMLSDPIMWVFVLVGTLIGVVVGAMPAMGATVAYGLVLPFTFVMTPVNAVAFLLSISVGVNYGNSIPAILMAVPGTPSAILTCMDGYALHKRGESGLALAVSFVAALAGQLISIVLFILCIVPLMKLTYLFNEPEQAGLYLFGIIAIISLTGKNVIKGVVSAGFGMAVSLVGLDPINLTPRFDFGFRILRSGFDIIPVVIGFLAVSELIRTTRQVFRWETTSNQAGSNRFPNWRRLVPTIKPILLGSIIGTLVGAIPGGGAATAALISYNQMQMQSKHPEEFGHGSVEGIAANESAQNASNSGELIPTFALGIPATGSMVLLLACLTVHGFLPGPLMIRGAPHLFHASIAGMLASTIFLFLTGWWMATMCLKAVNLDRQMVTVIALATVVMGIYSLNTRVFDVFVMGVAGIIGYFMLRYGYSTAGAALAVILGAGFERHLRFGLSIMENSWIRFITRPVTAVIVAGCLVLLVYGIYRDVKFRRKMKGANSKPA